MLELAGRLVSVKPLAVNKSGQAPGAGHVAVGEPLAVQLVMLQLDSPALNVSLTIALLAEVAPVLLKVTV